jgi:hypothetical protein
MKNTIIETPKYKTVKKEWALSEGFKPFFGPIDLHLKEDILNLANKVIEAKVADPTVKLVLVQERKAHGLWIKGLKKPDYVKHRAPGVHVGLKNPLPSNTRHQKASSLN